MSSKKLLCRNDSYAAPARARNAKLESSFAERALSLGAANASGMPLLPGARLCYRRVPVAPAQQFAYVLDGSRYVSSWRYTDRRDALCCTVKNDPQPTKLPSGIECASGATQ